MGQVILNQPQKRKRIHYRTWQDVVLHSVLILATIIVSIPIIWLALSSLKVESDLVSDSLQLFSSEIQWNNYRLALTEIPFWRYTRNSFVLAGISATLTMITSAMAGYAFARIAGYGREKLFAIVIVLILIPVGVYIIPQFIVFSNLKITNSYWPWVL